MKMSERKDDLELAVQILIAAMQHGRATFSNSEPETLLPYLGKVYKGIQELRGMGTSVEL